MYSEKCVSVEYAADLYQPASCCSVEAHGRGIDIRPSDVCFWQLVSSICISGAAAFMQAAD